MQGAQRGRRDWSPYLFLAPAVFLMLVFVYVPVAQNFRYSLFDWTPFSPNWDFVGLGNYRRLFTDHLFWQSMFNNIKYAFISVAFQVAVALILAALLESGVLLRLASDFFRTVIFLPSVLAGTVVGITWQAMYRPDTGLINQILNTVGLGNLTRAWLGDSSTAMNAIIAVSQWQWTGYITMLFVVAVRGIPAEYYEAAKLDGASGIRQFIDITVPSVRETTLVLVAVTVIGAFRVFDIVWVMTAGGPNHASEVLGSYMYRTAFRNNQMGYASTIAIMIFLITLSLTIVQLRLGRTGKDSR